MTDEELIAKFRDLPEEGTIMIQIEGKPPFKGSARIAWLLNDVAPGFFASVCRSGETIIITKRPDSAQHPPSQFDLP